MKEQGVSDSVINFTYFEAFYFIQTNSEFTLSDISDFAFRLVNTYYKKDKQIYTQILITMIKLSVL